MSIVVVAIIIIPAIIANNVEPAYSYITNAFLS